MWEISHLATRKKFAIRRHLSVKCERSKKKFLHSFKIFTFLISRYELHSIHLAAQLNTLRLDPDENSCTRFLPNQFSCYREFKIRKCGFVSIEKEDEENTGCEVSETKVLEINFKGSGNIMQRQGLEVEMKVDGSERFSWDFPGDVGTWKWKSR